VEYQQKRLLEQHMKNNPCLKQDSKRLERSMQEGKTLAIVDTRKAEKAEHESLALGCGIEGWWQTSDWDEMGGERVDRAARKRSWDLGQAREQGLAGGKAAPAVVEEDSTACWPDSRCRQLKQPSEVSVDAWELELGDSRGTAQPGNREAEDAGVDPPE
jgi:hypothetical protein